MGIDPGVTTAIAILDVNGNLVMTASKKNFRHSEISKAIYEHGIPMIMASDKYPLPKTVEHISAAFPTKLSYPRQSLTRIEKLEMTRPFIEEEKPWSNRHERDALAAAVFAYNRIKPLIKRVKRKARDEARDYVLMNTILKGENIDAGLKQYNSGGQIIINEKKSLGKVRKAKAKKAL